MNPPMRNDHDAKNSLFLGLAPFLRMSISRSDLKSFCKEQIDKALSTPNDAYQLMNSSIAAQCMGQRELGLALQAEALSIRCDYHVKADIQPARMQVLLLLGPGDLSANVPLECLLEQSDINLAFLYLKPDALLQGPIPPHDVLMVGLGESDANERLLPLLEPLLASWPKPVINRPQHISRTSRDTAALLLRDAPGVLMPPTSRTSRAVLSDCAGGRRDLSDIRPDHDFPIILRPVDSHGGHGLEKIENIDQIASYLTRESAESFYISNFIDYSHKDGYFRKIRVALINGQAFACHMAVSSHWMVHYVNAGMYEEAWKREEESKFMAEFNHFLNRHRAALKEIYEQTKLDYVSVDCAELQDGRLLIFEIDHAMVIHAMDLEKEFPFKKFHMQKVISATRHYLLRLAQMPITSHERT